MGGSVTTGVRISGAIRAKLEKLATDKNTTLSTLVRQLVESHVDASAPDSVSAITVYHVDDLGHDSLRADNGALVR